MRTTLDLPDPLFRQIKSYAALRGQTLKALLEELIESGMQNIEDKLLPSSKTNEAKIDLSSKLTSTEQKDFEIDEFLYWRRQQKLIDYELDETRSKRLDAIWK